MTPLRVQCESLIYLTNRREALRRWKEKHGTYGNLLKVCVKAGHTRSAEAICEVLRKKCKERASSSAGQIVSNPPSCSFVQASGTEWKQILEMIDDSKLGELSDSTSDLQSIIFLH